MLTSRCFRASLPVTMLAVAGCAHPDGHRRTLVSVLSDGHGVTGSTPLQYCDAPRARLGGRMKLVLPKSQTVAPVSQQVFLSNEKEAEGSDADDKDLGLLNAANPKGRHTNETNPYHIYIRKVNFSDYDRPRGHSLVAVKVVIPDGADYKFDEDDRPNHWIQGIGLYEESYPGSLCVRRGQQVANPVGTRQVATFYIDLVQAFRNGDEVASFEVRIRSRAAGGARGTVDPKVYNDG